MIRLRFNVPQIARPTAVVLFAATAVLFVPAAKLLCGNTRSYDSKALPADARPIASISPYVEAHSHFDNLHPEASVESALRSMEPENAEKIIFMPSPFDPDDSARYEINVFLPAVKNHRDKLAFLGGGGTLNVMIQQSVRSGNSGPGIQHAFSAQAEEIIGEGAIGFGEMTAEHLAVPPSKSYQYAPPDHPLFLLLADIAAKHGVPIEIHMEAVPKAMPVPSGLPSPPNPAQLHENIAEFERLLDHNRQAKIIWAHAGSDNTGYRTPELCRRLLQAHANLYMSVKVDPAWLGKNVPVVNGKVDPKWLKLFEDFPDRFVIGSDQHYGTGPIPTNGPQRWQSTVLLLNQLPEPVRSQIASGNARRIYGLAN